eukprot:3082283-Alexandrium_andersonii.AAC.1
MLPGSHWAARRGPGRGYSDRSRQFCHAQSSPPRVVSRPFRRAGGRGKAAICASASCPPESAAGLPLSPWASSARSWP